MTGHRELFTAARRSTGLSLADSARFLGIFVAGSTVFPRNRCACGERMSQSTSKSMSCLEILGTLQISVRTTPCFRAWSTLALVDYLQSDVSLNRNEPPEADPSEDSTLDRIDSETVRGELQELLRRAYAHSWKSKRARDDRN